MIRSTEKKLLLIVLSTFFVMVSSFELAQQEQNQKNATNLAIGDIVTISINISETTPKQYFFNIAVDKFSALRINNILQQQLSTNFTVEITILGSDSEQNSTTIRITSNKCKVFSIVASINSGSFLNLIIEKNSNCPDESVTYGMNNCSVPPEDDLTFYISWDGTDAHGNYMLSSSKRLSKYNQYLTQQSNIFSNPKLDPMNG